jgi:cell wall-associated NlpC family hydrolase
LRTFLLRVLFCLTLSFTVAAPVLSAGQTYAVVHGDTLSSIAEREHVTVTEIVRLNHLSDADYLRDGQVLRLTTVVRRPKSKTKLLAGKATIARHSKHARSVAKAANGPGQAAERQAIWVAMHSGFSTQDFAGSSFAAAQKAVALELAVTKTALRYLGVPYMWGGESFNGVDCSGFVQAVFHRNGIELPRTADAQYEVGRRVSERGLQPGDLVFFQTYAEGASHVGIYLGSGQFVHASYSNGVRVDSLSAAYYSSRYLGARRAAI